MPWESLADLPFAAALRPPEGPLAPDGDHDCVHFDGLVLENPAASGSRFLECAFTGVRVQGGQLRRSRFTDVWLRGTSATGSGLAESDWTECEFSQCALAGAEAFGSTLRRVVLRGCKLDSVNFRDCSLTDVTFESCVLRDVDFSGAALTRTAFPGCRLTRVNLTRARLDRTDLRGAELGLLVDAGSLRGAVISPAQLAQLAGLLAESMGIVVEDS